MEFMSSLSSAQDDLKPSLFEILSEEHLHCLLPPTLRHLLALATHRHPRYLIRILNRYEEVYALCMLVVEGYYLRKYAGGFTENFYGIKRERVVPGDVAGDGLKRVGPLGKFRKLGRREVLGSLLFGVGGEYVEAKLEQWYEALTVGEGVLGRRRDDRPDSSAPLKDKLKYWLKFLFKAGYPPLKLLLSLQKLGFSLLYLFGNTAFPSLSFYLLGLRPRRVTSVDLPPPTASSKSKHTTRQILTNPILLVNTAVPLALGSLKLLLPTGIFFLKFLEWWYASDFARQLSSASQKAIELPPPARLQETEKERALKEKNAERGVAPTDCPVCGEELNNATVVQTGAVCCYKCAFAAAEEGKCAVTGREVLGGTSGLRRLIA